MDNKQEVRYLTQISSYHADTSFTKLIDIIETVYRGASKGRGLVVSPKGLFEPLDDAAWSDSLLPDYSTRYRY